MSDTTGKKEIKEAVLIACLAAVGSQAIAWGVEEIKAAVKRKRDSRVKKDEPDAKE